MACEWDLKETTDIRACILLPPFERVILTLRDMKTPFPRVTTWDSLHTRRSRCPKQLPQQLAKAFNPATPAGASKRGRPAVHRTLGFVITTRNQRHSQRAAGPVPRKETKDTSVPSSTSDLNRRCNGQSNAPGGTPCVLSAVTVNRGGSVLLIRSWSQRELHTPVSNHLKINNNGGGVLNHT